MFYGRLHKIFCLYGRSLSPEVWLPTLLDITPQHCVIGPDVSKNLMSSYSRTQRFENSKAELKDEICRHSVTGLWLALTVSGLLFDLENKEFEISQRMPSIVQEITVKPAQQPTAFSV